MGERGAELAGTEVRTVHLDIHEKSPDLRRAADLGHQDFDSERWTVYLTERLPNCMNFYATLECGFLDASLSDGAGPWC